jgi:uncharacterized protein (DUF1919 family)
MGLTNRNFTIISNNCWGGFVYQRFNLPYLTPFIGLFVPAPCFIKLLEDFENNIQKEMRFIACEDSSYYVRINTSDRVYPIGVLGDDIEIHFLHYKTEEDARDSWKRRKKRIKFDNMFIKFAEMDCCTPDLITRFEHLPFKHKICLTAHEYPNCKSVLCLTRKYIKGDQVVNESKFVPDNLVELLNNCIEEKK